MLLLGVAGAHVPTVQADNPVIYPHHYSRMRFPGPPPSPVPLAKWGPGYPYGWFGVVRGQRSLSGSQRGYHMDWRELQFAE